MVGNPRTEHRGRQTNGPPAAMASFSLHPFCLLCWWLFRLERGEAIKPTPRLTVTHKNHQEGFRPRRFQVLRKVSSERATHPVVRPTRTHTLPRRNCIIANLAALTHSITEMKWAYLLLLRCCSSFYARSRLLFVSLAVGFIFFSSLFLRLPNAGEVRLSRSAAGNTQRPTSRGIARFGVYAPIPA